MQYTDEEIDNVNLGFCLNLISHNQNNSLKKELEKFNISYSEFIFIICIYYHDSCSQSHIARDLNVSEAYVTKIIKKLENKELIVKEINPNKKTEKLINISRKGETVYNEIDEINKKWEEKISKNLNKEEIKNLKLYLLKICMETNNSNLEYEDIL